MCSFLLHIFQYGTLYGKQIITHFLYRSILLHFHNHLLSKLQMIGVLDESLDRILAGHSIGRFEKK